MGEEEEKKKRLQEEVRARIICFIKKHYAKTLGADIKLLDQPGGLEKLHQKYCPKDPEGN